jgi:hypothetical protein
MAHERRGKQRASSPEIEYSPSDSEVTQEASPMADCTGKQKAVVKAPLRSRGHERPNPHGTSAHGAHPCMKRTFAPATHMSDAGESIEYLERIILRMQPPIRLTVSQFNGTCLVDYKKGKHDIYALRYDDPSEYAKEQQGDVRFWMNFHADWYSSVILCKSHPSTEMKSINWEYLFEIDLPVVREVQDAW